MLVVLSTYVNNNTSLICLPFRKFDHFGMLNLMIYKNFKTITKVGSICYEYYTLITTITPINQCEVNIPKFQFID